MSVAGEGRNRGELSQANRLMGALSAWRAATLGDSWRLRVSLLRRHNFVHLRAQKKRGEAVMVHASPESRVALITTLSHRRTPYTSILYTPYVDLFFCLELKEDLYNFTPLLDDSRAPNGL